MSTALAPILMTIVSATTDVGAAHKCLTANGGPYAYMERLSEHKVLCTRAPTKSSTSTYKIVGAKAWNE